MTDALHSSILAHVFRYMAFVMEIRRMGYCPILWGPVASNILIDDNPEYPNYGSTIERNIITAEFSSQLKKQCVVYEIDFISVFSSLVDDSMYTKSQYYFDGVHLDQTAWSFAAPKICSWLIEEKRYKIVDANIGMEQEGIIS